MIQSLQNIQLKSIKKLAQSKKYRQETGCYLIENKHYIKELLTDNSSLIERIFVIDSHDDIVSLCVEKNVMFDLVEEGLLDQVGHVKHSQGVIAIVRMSSISNECSSEGTHLYLSNVSNPSNFGSICRNAAAFNVSHIIFPSGTVDPFHPESVRASGGTIHLHSFVEMDLASYQSRYKRPSFMLSSNEGSSLYDCSFEKNTTFIVGSEMGFSDDIKGCLAVTIPMNDAVDSLNVAVSTGIALSYLYSQKNSSTEILF